MRGALVDRRGEALIVVICVMAVMMTLSLVLLSSAGLLVANSQRGYRQEQARIAATTLSACVREELNGANAMPKTDDGGLAYYLSQNVQPLAETGGWDYYTSPEEAAADKTHDKMYVSTMESGVLPAGFAAAIERAEIGIYCIADATKLTSGDFATQCGAITLVVATTVYGIDETEYTVKTAYMLSGSGENNEKSAVWQAKELLP